MSEGQSALQREVQKLLKEPKEYVLDSGLEKFKIWVGKPLGIENQLQVIVEDPEEPNKPVFFIVSRGAPGEVFLILKDVTIQKTIKNMPLFKGCIGLQLKKIK